MATGPTAVVGKILGSLNGSSFGRCRANARSKITVALKDKIVSRQTTFEKDVIK